LKLLLIKERETTYAESMVFNVNTVHECWACVSVVSSWSRCERDCL